MRSSRGGGGLSSQVRPEDSLLREHMLDGRECPGWVKAGDGGVSSGTFTVTSGKDCVLPVSCTLLEDAGYPARLALLAGREVEDESEDGVQSR